MSFGTIVLVLYLPIFSLSVRMNRKSWCTTSVVGFGVGVGVSGGIGVCKMLEFYVKDFYVMDKVSYPVRRKVI